MAGNSRKVHSSHHIPISSTAAASIVLDNQAHAATGARAA